MSNLLFNSTTELQLELSNPHSPSLCIKSPNLLVNPCLITQDICFVPEFNVQTLKIQLIFLFTINHSSMLKHSTCFFPIKDIYARIFSSQTHNDYFGGNQTKDQNTYLTFFRITGQSFKKLVSPKLNSVGVKPNANALHFL